MPNYVQSRQYIYIYISLKYPIYNAIYFHRHKRSHLGAVVRVPG